MPTWWQCGWPLGRLGAWHSVLTKQRISALEAVSSALSPLLYGLDNCPSLTGLCLGSAAPRPVQLWFEVKVLHKANLLSGACTWPVPLWGSPKQSLLQFLPLRKLSLVWAESPQAGIDHHRASWSQTFSSAQAPREEPTKQVNLHRAPPTARPLKAYYSCSFWGPPTPSSSQDSWAPLWTLGSRQAVLLPHQTDQQREWSEVQGRETCTHGGRTGVRVWSDLSPPVMVAVPGKGSLALLSLSKQTVKLSLHKTSHWTSYASTQAAPQKERLQEAVSWGSCSWASGNSLSSPPCQRTGAEGR